MNTYESLKLEGAKDIKFFKDQHSFFQRLLAVKSFGDLKLCFDLNSAVLGLNKLIKECRTHQIHLERTELEHKSHISELCRNLKNPNGEERDTRPTNTKSAKPKPKITWTT